LAKRVNFSYAQIPLYLSDDNNHSVLRRLPWWTWIAPLLLFHLGSQISIQFKYAQGVSDFYLPTAFALILIQWWGPKRIIPAMYINAVLSTYFWGIPVDRWPQWLVYGMPETIFVALSWYLFRVKGKGAYWLPDIRSVIVFIVLAISIPILVEVTCLQLLLVYFGDQQPEFFWDHLIRNGLGEFTSNFGLAAPVLFYFTGWMKRNGLALDADAGTGFSGRTLKMGHIAEITVAFIILLVFVFVIDFTKYWFIYGLFSLYIAIRFGFGPATITNYYLFMITYIKPKFFDIGEPGPLSESGIISVFLGTSLLYVFAAITGRMITDVRIAEKKLQRQNTELEQANAELDRFVYSVSHDLSAPLKSILGLVNIGRISNNTSDQMTYLGKIETSVKKLEAFIGEVLDYSHNKRLELIVEHIKLQDLCKEILENLKYADESQHIEVDMNQISDVEISNDKTRLKIILNNILANAIKYQKKTPGHRPQIKISSKRHRNRIVIDIEDNGEGIHPEIQSKIFNMFFRGNHNSMGSGLGLYIAREAAEKLNGNISVRSEYGKGSTFRLELENRNPGY
jgi:two-component system, sensor histidine kinase